jgi:hypothetical protein
MVGHQHRRSIPFAIAYVFVLLGAGFAVSCSDDRMSRYPAFAELYVIQNANPAEALEFALRRHDTRFLGVAGFSLEVPGAEDVYDTVVRNYGVREIYGPGDVGVSDQQVKLLVRARAYAKKYNTILLRWLADHPKEMRDKKGVLINK